MLESLDLLLAADGALEHFSVALLLGAELIVLEDLFGVIVTEKFKVALLVEEVSLAFEFAFLLLLAHPLLLEHGALDLGELALLLLDLSAGVLLPVEDSLGVLHELLLLLDFLALTLLLGQEVKLPQLGIHMLFHDLVLHQTLLVHQLLLTLHLALQDEEFARFLTEVVSCYI